MSLKWPRLTPGPIFSKRRAFVHNELAFVVDSRNARAESEFMSSPSDGVDKKLHPLEEFYRAIEFAQIDEEDRRMTEIRRLEMEAAAKKAASDKKKADKAARKKLKADFKAEQKRLDEEAKKAMEEEFDAVKLKKMKNARCFADPSTRVLGLE